jgi:divalent metal cation (Fe/Co/Zn/Cd) transporter
MEDKQKLLKIALWLAIITIVYNVVEGVISIFFGISDETLSLLGFGIDSMVEVISGIGILHMVIKLRKHGEESRDLFERRALKITGSAFILLAVGLVLGSVMNILADSKPQTTVPGIIISALSIATMYFLMRYKLSIGKKLNSDAIIADANCTKTCFYLSIILLISSLLYEFFRISYIDIAGSLGIAYFAIREGIESFQKAAGKHSCSCNDSCH